MAVTALFGAIIVLGALIAGLPPTLRFLSDPIILEFCFGMAIALLYRAGLRLPSVTAAALAVAAFAVFLASGAWSGVVDWRAAAWGLPAAVLVGAVALSARKSSFGIAGRAFAFLGDASYSLYLLHPIVMLAVPKILLRVIDPASAPWFCAFVMLAAPVAVACIAYPLFERPVTRWLQSGLRLHAAPREPEGSPVAPVSR